MATSTLGIEQIAKNIRHELYKNHGDLKPMSCGMMIHANATGGRKRPYFYKPHTHTRAPPDRDQRRFNLLATNKLPSVQNAAIELSIEPRLFLG